MLGFRVPRDSSGDNRARKKSQLVCNVTWYFALLGISHTFPGPFGVDNRTRPRPYPSTCLETLNFEARELLVHRDDRRYGPDRDTLA